MEKVVATEKALAEEAERFVRSLNPATADATLVTLSGELGAGKTAYVKAAAKALGVTDTVTSPTFVLEKIYKLSKGAFKRLIHIDAYRLESGIELAPLGFDELMRAADNLIMLEWPEKVADALPSATTRISIKAAKGGARTISYA